MALLEWEKWQNGSSFRWRNIAITFVEGVWQSPSGSEYQTEGRHAAAGKSSSSRNPRKSLYPWSIAES
jgi:hypothetical protein